MIKLPVKILSPKSPEPIQPRTVLRFIDNNVLFLALSADAAQNHILFAKLGKLLLFFFSISISFYEHSRITGQQDKGEAILLTPQPLPPASHTLRH